MSIQQQAYLSGLGFLHEKPQWQKLEWPKLPGDLAVNYASVVVRNIDNPDIEHVVVFGGYTSPEHVDSVFYLNVGDENPQWREGPRMNKKRACHAGVVCNGRLYAIGGSPDSRTARSVEKIDIPDLFQTTTNPNLQDKKLWTKLKCRLFFNAAGCSATAVRDRFIVVHGVQNSNGTTTSEVQIIDTAAANGQHTVTLGPCLNQTRTFFGMAAIGSRIYAVGGMKENMALVESVESWEFDEEWAVKNANASGPSEWTSCWHEHPDLFLHTNGVYASVISMGSCLVVQCLKTVLVLDPQINVLWSLPKPPPTGASLLANMLLLSHGITMIGWIQGDCCGEVLPLMEKNSAMFARLLTWSKETPALYPKYLNAMK